MHIYTWRKTPTLDFRHPRPSHVGGGLRGGGAQGDRRAQNTALDAALKAAAAGGRVAATGGNMIQFAPEVGSDASALLRFLEPWTATVGKDPKEACKDPKLLAARAAAAAGT